MQNQMKRIGKVGLLFAALTLFSGCYNAAEEHRKAIHQLAHAMAQMGYEYGRSDVPYSVVTNEVNRIMDKVSR